MKDVPLVACIFQKWLIQYTFTVWLDGSVTSLRTRAGLWLPRLIGHCRRDFACLPGEVIKGICSALLVLSLSQEGHTEKPITMLQGTQATWGGPVGHSDPQPQLGPPPTASINYQKWVWQAIKGFQHPAFEPSVWGPRSRGTEAGQTCCAVTKFLRQEPVRSNRKWLLLKPWSFGVIWYAATDNCCTDFLRSLFSLPAYVHLYIRNNGTES